MYSSPGTEGAFAELWADTGCRLSQAGAVPVYTVLREGLQAAR